MKTYKIHFIRHGMTSANISGKYNGREDLPLCDEGREEIEEYVQSGDYPTVQMVYTSPLERAVETAEIIYPDTFMQIVDELEEFDFGDFEGKTPEELMDNPEYGDWISIMNTSGAPGGESSKDFIDRISNGLQIVIANMMRNDIKDAAVITHGGIISTLLSKYVYPHRGINEWITGNGRGYTVLIHSGFWEKSGVMELYDKIPSLHGEYEYYDEDAYLDYAESLLDDDEYND